MKITGTLNGEKQRVRQRRELRSRATRSNAFIPRLWATRRVGWLLDEIRMHGEPRS